MARGGPRILPGFAPNCTSPRHCRRGQADSGAPVMGPCRHHDLHALMHQETHLQHGDGLRCLLPNSTDTPLCPMSFILFPLLNRPWYQFWEVRAALRMMCDSIQCTSGPSSPVLQLCQDHSLCTRCLLKPTLCQHTVSVLTKHPTGVHRHRWLPSRQVSVERQRPHQQHQLRALLTHRWDLLGYNTPYTTVKRSHQPARLQHPIHHSKATAPACLPVYLPLQGTAHPNSCSHSATKPPKSDLLLSFFRTV